MNDNPYVMPAVFSFIGNIIGADQPLRAGLPIARDSCSQLHPFGCSAFFLFSFFYQLTLFCKKLCAVVVLRHETNALEKVKSFQNVDNHR